MPGLIDSYRPNGLVRVNVNLDDDVFKETINSLDSINRKHAEFFAKILQDKVQGPVFQGILNKIKREPYPVIYADNGRLRWKNDRQRNKVLMMLRQQHKARFLRNRKKVASKQEKGNPHSGQNIAYIRTHMLSKGWDVELSPWAVPHFYRTEDTDLGSFSKEQLMLGGIIYFINRQTRQLGRPGSGKYYTRNVYDYVQGDWTQPFHLDTRWPQAAEIVTINSSAAQEEIVEAWYHSYQQFGKWFAAQKKSPYKKAKKQGTYVEGKYKK